MSSNIQDIDFICDLIRERTSNVLSRDKAYLVETRLAEVMRKVGVKSLRELVVTLKKNKYSPVITDVQDALVTNETFFFRDQAPFDALAKTILPEIMPKRKAKRQLTIWSAACSSGQEPYSIAMMLLDKFPELDGWDVKIYATDISKKVLKRATAGAYNRTEIGRGLPPSYTSRFFKQQGTNWVVDARVRRMIEFRQANLAMSWPPMRKVDVVFLRNVMIYFDAQTKKGILGKVRRVMNSDGYMFMGAGESTMALDPAFVPKRANGAVMYSIK